MQYKSKRWIPARAEKYPKEIIGDRPRMESQLIAVLYNIPDLFEEYPLDPNIDLFTDDGKFFYNLGKRLYDQGYRSIEEVDIDTYVENDKPTRDALAKHGGYADFDEIRHIVDNSNVDAYYDAVMRSNMLCRLYDEKFGVMHDIDVLSDMSPDEIRDFYEYKLNDIAIGGVTSVHPVNLSTGYDSHFDLWDSGREKGFDIGFPILNHRLAGVHKKNMLLHLSTIGNGKTTSAILFYILPAIQAGENVCVLANEQDEDEWRQMVIASVMFNKTLCESRLNRHAMIVGGFTPEERKDMERAQKWLEAQPGKITYLDVPNYSIGSIEKLIRKHSQLGCTVHIVDTFKAQEENSERAWADLSEAAKALFQVAKKEDIALVATAQLSSEAMRRKFLDLSCVGKSRAISETATQVVMFRTMTESEKEDLNVYRYFPDDSTRGEQIFLDASKDYIILFTPKNRFGRTNPQIVYERNMDFNTLREIGTVEIPFDYGGS